MDTIFQMNAHENQTEYILEIIFLQLLRRENVLNQYSQKLTAKLQEKFYHMVFISLKNILKGDFYGK